MEEFHYDFVYHDQQLIEINTLFAPSLEVALGWLDETYLTVHAEAESKPDLIRLRKKDSDDTIAEFATHFDAVR